eukprot:1517236-Rhodomonas_salina.1
MATIASGAMRWTGNAYLMELSEPTEMNGFWFEPSETAPTIPFDKLVFEGSQDGTVWEQCGTSSWINTPFPCMRLGLSPSRAVTDGAYGAVRRMW